MKDSLLVKRSFMVGIAAAGYVIDRLTKQWALVNLSQGGVRSLLGGTVSFELLFNSGAAFSMGSSVTVIFSVLSIAALLFVVLWAWPRVNRWLLSLASGLVAAGIAGNLTDRLLQLPGAFRGNVVDFIAVPHFAVFNVADVCITAAAVLFAIHLLFFDKSDSGKSTHGAGD